MAQAVGYNETDALAELQDRTQSAIEPVLTTAELLRYLRFAAIADENGNEPDAWPSWSASTAYSLNYRVVPATRNGYVYIVTTAGISGASGPSFSTTIDATTSDNTVTWTTEATAPWVPTYSNGGIDRAAFEGWTRKYQKLTAGETFSADGASFDPARRRADIMEMIRLYKSKAGSAGSFKLTGRTARIEHWDDSTSLVVN